MKSFVAVGRAHELPGVPRRGRPPGDDDDDDVLRCRMFDFELFTAASRRRRRELCVCVCAVQSGRHIYKVLRARCAHHYIVCAAPGWNMHSVGVGDDGFDGDGGVGGGGGK